jgi:hypothetical protein
MTRIVKPTKDQVEEYLYYCDVVAYQHINWWLYQKGSDEIIWFREERTPLYFWCIKNRVAIIKDMAKMVGLQPAEDRYDRLLHVTTEREKNDR